MANEYFTGDTIRAIVNWTDALDPDATPTPLDPVDEVTNFVVYDAKGKQVHTGTATKAEVGEYYYDYTFPSTAGTFILEFNATFGSGPQVSRQQVKSKFKL